jgi:hypothetical protein
MPALAQSMIHSWFKLTDVEKKNYLIKALLLKLSKTFTLMLYYFIYHHLPIWTYLMTYDQNSYIQRYLFSIFIKRVSNSSSKTRGQRYKTFYGRTLRIFVISYSVCPWQALTAYSNKHYSLVRKFVNYECKKFYNIGPRPQTFYGRNLQFL